MFFVVGGAIPSSQPGNEVKTLSHGQKIEPDGIAFK